ncbi:SixA phosphatase family protein [Nocardioides jiangxiensis]|uniref:Histidine phosphatase family protein n=1 Tax=Nocardioides jiangxiensis TaxID=3064524 RepID=A0ABT9B176_9ACTN|nr:histidine phosphatase family protein [Nocardioides sp. WY-20]MDO7868433.1 histidine phosphatase family protein [Nocardioides sp. WY-20]
MRTLIVVRHGKSDWSGDEPDRERPLAKRGRRQLPASAAWIAEHHPVVDLAVVSPALRAQQTWDVVAESLDGQPEVVTDERVYAAWGRDLVPLVRALPATMTTVALVGHNPGLEELVAELTGEGVELPTSAVAVLAFADGWTGDARVVAHGRPPEDRRTEQ